MVEEVVSFCLIEDTASKKEGQGAQNSTHGEAGRSSSGWSRMWLSSRCFSSLPRSVVRPIASWLEEKPGRRPNTRS